MDFAAPIHPTEVVPETIVASSRSRGWNGLIVERSVTPPREIEVAPLTEHLVLVHLGSRLIGNKKPRQVSRFDNSAFEKDLCQGDNCLIPAGIPSFHSWTTIDDAVLISVEPNLLRRVAEETCEAHSARVELISRNFARDAELERIALLFKGELENDNFGGRLFGDSLANLLALQLLRSNCVFNLKPRSYKGGLAKHKLTATIEFIRENLDDDLSLETLAANCDLSLHHFARAFKHSTGLAPHQYVLQQRVERAKRLIAKSSFQNLTEIGLSVGFYDQAHFAKAFKRVTGATPKMYKEK